jgi:hypothetical protein
VPIKDTSPNATGDLKIRESKMTDRTDRQELEILRVSLARVAQAMGDGIAREIPGCDGRSDLGIGELSRLARERDRGWNRLCAVLVGCALEGRAA